MDALPQTVMTQLMASAAGLLAALFRLIRLADSSSGVLCVADPGLGVAAIRVQAERKASEHFTTRKLWQSSNHHDWCGARAFGKKALSSDGIVGACSHSAHACL